MTTDELLFLKESNAIEGVYDVDSFHQATHAWKYLKEQKKITMPEMLKAHKILMLHQMLMPNEKGYFREVPVWIGGREAPDWRTIRTELRKWEDLFKVSHDWKALHVWFEHIHPFVDGNGRIGRMIMNWHRLKLKLPILIIHAGQEQQEYYKWFHEIENPKYRQHVQHIHKGKGRVAVSKVPKTVRQDKNV